MQEALDFLTLTDRSASDRLVNAMFSHHLLIVGQTGSGKTAEADIVGPAITTDNTDRLIK